MPILPASCKRTSHGLRVSWPRRRLRRPLAGLFLSLSVGLAPATSVVWADDIPAAEEGAARPFRSSRAAIAPAGGRRPLSEVPLEEFLQSFDAEAQSSIRDLDQDISAEEALLALLSDSDSHVRGQAVEVSGRYELNSAAMEQIRALTLDDRNAIVQAKARLALADFGNVPATTSPIPARKSIGDAAPSPSRPRTSLRPAEPQFPSPPAANPATEEPEAVRISVNTDWWEPSESPAPSAPPALRRSGNRSGLESAGDVGTAAIGSATLGLPFAQLASTGDETTPFPGDPFFPAEYAPGESRGLTGDGLASLDGMGRVRPEVLDRPLFPSDDVFTDPSFEDPDFGFFTHPVDAPLGYTGRSSVAAEDYQLDSHFVPLADRWRSGSPAWDRYGKGHPPVDDYPYQEGHWWDPYNENVLKGDFPVIGQHTFLKLTGQALLINEYRQVPTATTPFESTVNPGQQEFFGDPNQYFTSNFFRLSVELFHGNSAFKPIDWAVRVTPIFNFNYLDVNELGVVNPDVRRGTTRQDNFLAIEEYFLEAKLADLSPDYDFLSARIGSQPFTSDFRGFIFSDINRGVRLFGTRFANRDQFNLVYFNQAEKDTNSQLNTFSDRNQDVFIANYYRQDFVFPGYTAQASIHHNIDGPSKRFDKNGFLVRPDAAGNAAPHKVEATYLGFTGEGHMGRVNVSNSFYWVVGKDSSNPIAGQQQDINAQLAAIELSYDRDWIRFRASFLWASGDDDPKDGNANGFDGILDNPNFAGGEFSFWQRQQIQLFNVGLTGRNSLFPDLVSNKFQGQSNFVNPGLLLFNLGMDFEITPKLRLVTNANYLEFDETSVLERFTFQDDLDKTIGVDLSAGIEYRPYHNDNVILQVGYACLLPGRGFEELYGTTDPIATANAANVDADTLHQAFAQLVLTY